MNQACAVTSDLNRHQRAVDAGIAGLEEKRKHLLEEFDRLPNGCATGSYAYFGKQVMAAKRHKDKNLPQWLGGEVNKCIAQNIDMFEDVLGEIDKDVVFANAIDDLYGNIDINQQIELMEYFIKHY